MENQVKKTGRTFKYVNKIKKDLAYKKDFKEGKTYEEGSDELTEFLTNLMPKRMVINGDFLNMLTEDGMPLTVLSKDFELVEDYKIEDNKAILTIEDIGPSYKVELKSRIDLRVLKKALKETLKDVKCKLKQIDQSN